MKRLFFIIFLLILSIFFYFFSLSKSNFDYSAHNLSKKDLCVVDGMIILNYNGPKAQIVWKNKSRSFYCEVKEAFYDYLDPIKTKQIAAFFVQDFSNLDWGSYCDKWILASKAYYVIDSSKDGAMGLTYVPFIDINSANSFYNNYGGKILFFDKIDVSTLNDSSKLLKDRLVY